MKNLTTENEKFLLLRIEALEKECKRLNVDIENMKSAVSKTRLSDPNFLKPLSEIEVNFEIINP